jgi:orotidine-5'-phosphate decarboxylase
MRNKSPIILALDGTDISSIDRLIIETRDSIDIYKFGLEFYLFHGRDRLAKMIKEHGIEIFLDLKLHDIPNTVAGAARSIAELNPFILTVHASGAGAMIAAAAKELPRTIIAAVTVLTSLNQDDLSKMGIAASSEQVALSMARVAADAGARAIVSSAHEVAAIKKNIPEVLTITPGIRPAGVESHDQARTMTPAEAINAGSDFLVIGRPITASPDPKHAASEILASIRR